MPFAKTFAANALRSLLVVNAIASIAAAIVLMIEPGAIPGAVGINLHSSQNLIVYLLAAAELAIGVLCLLALRPAVAVAIRHTVGVLIIFHIASGVAGLAAMVQGASPLIGWNVAVRLVMAVALAWFAWGAGATLRQGGTPLLSTKPNAQHLRATRPPQRYSTSNSGELNMTNGNNESVDLVLSATSGSVISTTERNRQTIERLFAGVTARSRSEVLESFDSEVVIHEAQSLPYGGDYVGLEGLRSHVNGYMDAWNDLQGTSEKLMDPQILMGKDIVAVAWQQRGRNPTTGETFEEPVMSLYRMADGKVKGSRMFHFDSASVRNFLTRFHEPKSIDSKEFQLNELLVAGEFKAAFEKFYADDVEMSESGSPVTKGKQANRFREAFIYKIVTTMTAQLLGSAVNGQTTYSEWAYIIQVQSGKTLSYRQVAVRKWRDGLVAEEQFFHPDFPSWLMTEIANANANANAKPA